jgi:YihY family inner membrane protein
MRARLAALARFVGGVLAKSHRDEVLLRSSALAFATLLALVPLLAVVSIFVARTLREDDGRILQLITALLPYREESVITALHNFLDQAESVSGVALAGFVATSLLTFFGVQESLFHIFGVARPPSMLRRLASFSLLFVWGPLLVGTAQMALLVVGQANPELGRVLRASPLVSAVPGALTFVGLTMLYWRAAFQRISIRHAAVGGAVATVSLELLKLAFGLYVRELSEVQRAITARSASRSSSSSRSSWPGLCCSSAPKSPPIFRRAPRRRRRSEGCYRRPTSGSASPRSSCSPAPAARASRSMPSPWRSPAPPTRSPFTSRRSSTAAWSSPRKAARWVAIASPCRPARCASPPSSRPIAASSRMPPRRPASPSRPTCAPA